MIISPMSVTLIDSMGSDVSVVNAARVSFHKEHETFNEDTDSKLVNYLAKHGHWSPFAHAFLSFRIKAPIFVARQLVKHQVGLAWNEVSRRYVDEEPEFWFPKEWRGKPVNAKQGSSDVVLSFKDCYGLPAESPCIDLPTGCADVKKLAALCLDMYTKMIEQGIAPEQARMVLPQNMMTEWIWSGSLMAFARVCKLRLDPHAQAETREVAELISSLVPETFKHSWKALLG